jgi:hypothetical protein
VKKVLCRKVHGKRRICFDVKKKSRLMRIVIKFELLARVALRRWCSLPGKSEK